MRYDLARRFATLVRTLAELGEHDNSRALARRIQEGSAVAWLRGEHGEHVWAEIGGALALAARMRFFLPQGLGIAAVAGERAYGEAEALLAEELPRPGRIPADVVEHARPTLRVIQGGAVRMVPSNPPKRAA